MTERTMAGQAETDDDDISTTSTQESLYDPDKEYVVNRILAEKTKNKRKIYLILWENYPEEKATWEPKDHISPQILEDWAARKALEKQGIEKPFDVAGFQAKLNRLAREKEQRQKLRKAKRKRRGIPVSESDTPMADQDGSSSDEASEENEIEDAPAPRSSKRKARSPPKPAKKPLFQVVVRGSTVRAIEDNPLADVTNQKTDPQKAQGDASASSSRPRNENRELRKSPNHVRESSTSSSDIPIAQKKHQKIPAPELSSAEPTILRRPDLERSSSGPSGKKQPAQDRPNSSSSTSSRATQQTKPGIAPEVPSMSSKQTPPLFMDESPAPEPEKKPRGRPPTRGKIATRGGGAAPPRNVFEAGASSKTRGRKAGTNLLKMAMDPSKDPKIAGNRHTLRKLELQARDIAEAAPDIDAIGGLFDPSNMSSVKPVKPSTLRKSSSSLTTQNQKDPGEEADLDDLFEERNVLKPPAPPPPIVRQLRSRPTCFFWDRAQKDSRIQGCGNGYLCKYHHHYEPGIPVAPPPLGYIDISSETSTQNSNRKYICYFWDRAEQDSNHPKCTKGADCALLHSYEPGAIVAPRPPGVIDKPRNVSQTGQSDPTERHSSSSPPRPPWHKDSLTSQMSDGFQRSPTSREHHLQSPSNTEALTYSAMPPRRDESISNTEVNMLPTGKQFTLHSDAPVAQPQRPPWDPHNPRDAICHFWWETGKCIHGNNCKCYHSKDPRLAIAPSIQEQKEIKRHVPCKFFSRGLVCDNGNFCDFMHDRHNPENSRSYHQRLSTHDTEAPLTNAPTLPANSEPRKKTVKFLDEPTVFAEPEPISPPRKTQARPIQDEPREICKFWGRFQGSCHRGDACRYQHGYPRDVRDPPPEYQDIQMPDREERKQVFDNGDVQIPNRAVNWDMDMEVDPVQNDTRKELPLPRSQGASELHTYAKAKDQMSPLKVPSSTTPPPPAPPVSSARLAFEAEMPITVPKVPRKKVNLAEYQRQKTLKKIGARAKTVFLGRDESEAVILDFGDVQEGGDSTWTQEFAQLDTITFGQLCLAQDFGAHQGFFQRRGLFMGNIAAVDSENLEASRLIGKVADELVLRSAGLVASLPRLSILLFPASKEEWKFLESSSDCPKEGPLRYFVFEADMDIDGSEKTGSASMKLGKPYKRLMAKMIYGLDLKELLPQVDSSQNPLKFFLLFPFTADHTSKFMATWIKDCNSQSKIYDSQVEGSWDFFRKQFNSGVVLVHETVAANLHRLPQLFEVVAKKAFSFWSVSDGDSLYPLFPSRQYEPDESTMGRITATRLFPHGCAMLLTPSFIVAEPKKAYDLMKKFLVKLDTAVPGTWKIACAGNISDYLLDVAISKAVEKEDFEAGNRENPAKDAMLTDAGLSFEACTFRNKLHTLFAHFDARGWLDSPVESDDSDSDYAYREEKDTPIVQADCFIDPDNEPALIEWFAGWSMQNLDRFRKFIVIGTGPSSAGRAKRMKEYTVTLEASKPGARPGFLGTPNSNPRPFSINGNESRASIDNVNPSPRQDPKQHALDVAARLSALSPNKISPTTTSQVIQEISSNPSTSLANNDPFRDDERHKVDPSLSDAQIQVCTATGASAHDSTIFLQRAANNVSLAIEMDQDTDAMDLDTQIAQLIAEEQNPGPLRLAITEEHLARGAERRGSTNSFNMQTPSDVRRGSTGLPQHDGSYDAYSPQFDGANDRPSSPTSNKSTMSGIVSGADGQRFIPSSIRGDLSVRKERRVRPGFTPIEDFERYVSPGVATSRAGSRTASVRSSPGPAMNLSAQGSPGPQGTSVAQGALVAQEPAARGPASDLMEIDGGAEAASVAENGTNLGSGRIGDMPSWKDLATRGARDGGSDEKDNDPWTTATDPKPTKNKPEVKKEYRQYTYQETSAWYENYKKTNGGGWEHIFVGAHDDALKKSGLLPVTK